MRFVESKEKSSVFFVSSLFCLTFGNCFTRIKFQFYSHECPLSSTDAFGLPDDCKIPAVPCDFVFEEKSINPDVCYHHLITRHNLKNKIARMITDEYLKAKREGKDLTKIDILSDLNLPKILSESTAQFVTFCPLTKSNVFGLQADKHYRSCFSKTTIYLQQQFVFFGTRKIFHRDFCFVSVCDTPIVSKLLVRDVWSKL